MKNVKNSINWGTDELSSIQVSVPWLVYRPVSINLSLGLINLRLITVNIQKKHIIMYEQIIIKGKSYDLVPSIPTFLFGQVKAEFIVATSEKTVDIVIGDMRGSLTQLSKFISNPLLPHCFGKDHYKGWIPNIGISIIPPFREFATPADYVNIIGTMFIGNYAGTYSELINIYNHACSLIMKS